MAKKSSEKVHINIPLILVALVSMVLILGAASYMYVSISSTELHETAIKQLQYDADQLAGVCDSVLPSYYEEEHKDVNRYTGDMLNDYEKCLSRLYDAKKQENIIGFGSYLYETDGTESFERSNRLYSYYFDGELNEVLLNVTESSGVTYSKIEDNNISILDGNEFFRTDDYHTKSIDTNMIAIFYYHKEFTIDSVRYRNYIYCIYDLTNLLNNFLNIYHDSNYKDLVFMNREGRMYATASGDKAFTLTEYTKNNVYTSDYIDEINETGSGVKIFTINGRNFYYSTCPTLLNSNDNNLQLLIVVDGDYVDEINLNLQYLSIAYTLIIALAFIFIAMLLMITIYNEFFKYHVGKFSLLFIRNYGLIIKSNGEIKMKNKLFTKQLEIERNYHYVTDFRLVEEGADIFEKLNEGKSFLVRFFDVDGNEVLVRFVTIRNGSTYQLIGERESKDVLNNPKLERLAYFDKLTKLHNLNYLQFELLPDLIEKNVKGKALIDIDVRNFKQFTDVFNDSFADDIIRYLSRKITSLLPENTQIFSVKRDEFIFILDDFNYIKDPKIVNHLYDELRKPQNILDNKVNVEPAIGIYYLNDDEERHLPEDIISFVRLANRRAHEIVTNRSIYVYDNGLFSNIRRDSLIEMDIRDGIAKDEFVVYYQPQYDINTNKITGFEALLRWHNPKYANDSPYEYIRVAEKAGLIVQLSDIITRQSFKAAFMLINNGYEDAHISVNVSVAQLMQSGFAADFLEYYKEYNVPFSAISLEVTETMLMGSMSEVSSKLEVLRNKGIKIYIDDFGTGYSSLLYLNTLPIDFIKIDREFIKYLQHRKDARLVLTRILQLANDLEKEVVAEGVETQYQVNFLKRNDCHLIQGWIVSKAVPKEQILELMKFNKDLTK